jgi:hypothetical protein
MLSFAVSNHFLQFIHGMFTIMIGGGLISSIRCSAICRAESDMTSDDLYAIEQPAAIYELRIFNSWFYESFGLLVP